MIKFNKIVQQEIYVSFLLNISKIHFEIFKNLRQVSAGINPKIQIEFELFVQRKCFIISFLSVKMKQTG